MQLTIDIKETAMDKVMYLLNSLKSDVTIIDNNLLDIEKISENDSDYKYIKNGREERATHPENYGTMNEIDWN